jgi:hypothetical protein
VTEYRPAVGPLPVAERDSRPGQVVVAVLPPGLVVEEVAAGLPLGLVVAVALPPGLVVVVEVAVVLPLGLVGVEVAVGLPLGVGVVAELPLGLERAAGRLPAPGHRLSRQKGHQYHLGSLPLRYRCRREGAVADFLPPPYPHCPPHRRLRPTKRRCHPG